MSPLTLRRYRAERLLRQEFEGLRGRVLANVRGQLRARGVSLDQGDLEACYAIAWQGLYTAVLEGQEIANPAGWLVVVTFRRALDEQRGRARARAHTETETLSGPEQDFAAELDDRARLRQLFEGLRGRLNGREREAATLCYLQGLSRAQAAAQMGVSDARMRKLMEGRGPGRPGVAGKVGALVHTIREGDWCDEQGSLMRALAYGILDRDGERYQLALMHSNQCPACRAYVVSLRGLAVVLPPVFVPWGLGASAGAAASTGGAASGAGVGVSVASGAAGAGGAAGGGWLLTGGPLSAKLAVGCLLALGVGAGCVALERGHHAPGSSHRRHFEPRSGADAGASTLAASQLGDLAASALLSHPAVSGARARAALAPQARASLEFGPERALASSAARSVFPAGSRVPTARSASSRSASVSLGTVAAPSGGAHSSAGSGSTADAAAAEREFAPG